MKHAVSIVMCGLLLLGILFLPLGCTKKQEVSVKEAEKEEPKKEAPEKKVEPEKQETRTLKVIGPNDEFLIATMEIPPYSYQTEDGKIDEEKGWLIEVGVAVLKDMKQKYRWINTQEIQWDKQIQDLKTGEYHMWFSLFVTGDQAKMFNFALPSGGSSQGIFVMKDNPQGIGGETKEEFTKSLKGKKLTALQIMKASILENLGRDFEIVIAKDQFDVLDKVASGEMDAGLSPGDGGLVYIAEKNLPLKIVFSYERQVFAPAFSLVLDTSLIDRWNASFVKLLKDGTINKIREKYGVGSYPEWQLTTENGGTLEGYKDYKYPE